MPIEVEAIYRRAAALGESLQDAPNTYKAKWGLWLHANLARKTAMARDRADELVVLAQRSADGDLLLEAHHCQWSTAFFRGDIAAARNIGRVGLDRYDMARHRHLGPAFGGHDPGVCARLIVGLAAALSGEPKQVRREAEMGIALSEALDL